jgi:glutamine amidotransferase
VNPIVIVDYGIGNVRSIANALRAVGATSALSDDAKTIAGAPGLIIPGVGAFAHGMKSLRERALVEPILAYVKAGKPVLGICLGMQLFMERSDEHGATEGLGIVPGGVTRLEVDDPDVHRLPHVMWNALSEIAVEPEPAVLPHSETGKYYYFVHSYAASPTDAAHVLASTRYAGRSFCSAVRRDNVVGVQFHPEKSGPDGLALLRRFVQTCR